MDCYPVIDCRLKYLDWNKHIRCKPADTSDEGFLPLEEAVRLILEDNNLKKSVEIVCLNGNKLVSGLLTYADLLNPESDYLRDDAGRRLQIFVGIRYQVADGPRWIFPSKKQLSEIYESFMDVEWTRTDRKYCDSEPVDMKLKELKNKGNDPDISKKRVAPPSVALLDALSKKNESFLYVNKLPRHFNTDSDVPFYYSPRSLLNWNRLIPNE